MLLLTRFVSAPRSQPLSPFKIDELLEELPSELVGLFSLLGTRGGSPELFLVTCVQMIGERYKKLVQKIHIVM